MSSTGEQRLTIAERDYVVRMRHKEAAEIEELLGSGILGYNGGGVQYTSRVALVLLRGQHGIRTIDDVLSLMDSDAAAINDMVTNAVMSFILRHYPTMKAQHETTAAATAD